MSEINRYVRQYRGTQPHSTESTMTVKYLGSVSSKQHQSAEELTEDCSQTNSNIKKKDQYSKNIDFAEVCSLIALDKCH